MPLFTAIISNPLLRYLARRVMHGLLIIFAVSFITFYLMTQSPGSFFDRMRQDPKISKVFIAREEERLGLNKPWIVRYGLWLRGIVTKLDFGYSYENKVPVFETMWPRTKNSALLSFTSMVFAWLLAIPLGIIAGARQYSLFDRLSSAVAFIGISIPEVLLALIAIYFAARTGWFPRFGMRGDEWNELSAWGRLLDVAHHLVLPTLVLGIGLVAGYMRLMRGNLLDVLNADYIRTARAKGVSDRVVLFKHAVRNALNPLITLFGFSFSGLLSGAVLVENIMGYPGIGQQVVTAIFNKDTYLVMANMLIATIMLILGNLLADLLLVWSDPRVKLENRSGVV